MKKKILCSFLIVAIGTMLILSLFACKEKEEEGKDDGLQIAVLSDIHLMTEGEVGHRTTYFYKSHALKTQNLLFLSEAVYKSAIDNLIERKPDVVLMAGDLSETGSVDSLNVIAAGCKKLEQAGIRVFVTGGLSDFSRGYINGSEKETFLTHITRDGFCETFADYGYNEAIAQDEETLSYVVDLDETHRLLVLDTISTYDYTQKDFLDGEDRTPPVSNATMMFVDTELEKAQDARKEMLVMSYLPINDTIGEYFGAMTKTKMITIDRQEEFADMFSIYGVQYVVSGHMHNQNCLKLDNQYLTMYNYTPSALCCYPLEYLWMTSEEDKYIVEEKSIGAVREEYLPKCLTDEEKQAVLADSSAFAKQYILDHIWVTAQEYIDNNGEKNALFMRFLRKLSIYPSSTIDEEPKAIAFCESLYQGYLTLINMPLYGETDSIESVCKGYDIVLPKTSYTTVKDFIGEILCQIYTDDVHITSESPEAVVFRYIVYTGLKMIADLDIGKSLHEMNDAVVAFDLTGVADQIFTEGIIDVTKDNVGVAFLSILEPLLQKKGGIFSTTMLQDVAEDLLKLVDTVLPFVLAFTDVYDQENDTVYGIRYRKYFDIPKGIVYLQKFLDEGLIDVFAADLLF